MKEPLRLKPELSGGQIWRTVPSSFLSVCRRVVPPHSSFPDLLFQRAELLLPALLALPQLLAVLVAAASGAPQLLREQPGLPVARPQRRRSNVVLLEAAAWAQNVTGDNVNTVSGQALAEGELVAGAGVHTCV